MHPSGSAHVRERNALYLWIHLPAGARDCQQEQQEKEKTVFWPSVVSLEGHNTEAGK